MEELVEFMKRSPKPGRAMKWKQDNILGWATMGSVSNTSNSGGMTVNWKHHGVSYCHLVTGRDASSPAPFVAPGPLSGSWMINEPVSGAYVTHSFIISETKQWSYLHSFYLIVVLWQYCMCQTPS